MEMIVLTNNEKELNKEIQKIHQELYSIKNSLEYKAGKKITKTKCFSLLYWLKKKFSKNLPGENKITEMYVTNDAYPDLSKKKLAIYTCITGDYDNVVEPMYCNENIDYLLFTNNKKLKSNKWKVVYLDNKKNLYNVMLNRYVKMHPFEYLKNYDYSIYIDGNIRIYADISCYIEKINSKYGLALSMHSTRNKLSDEAKACMMLKKGNTEEIENELKRFMNEGMPDEYGLLEAPVIATNLKSELAQKIFDEWWDCFSNSKAYRDQIFLPYVLWKRKIIVQEIGTLSNNIWLDAKLEKEKHKNRK